MTCQETTYPTDRDGEKAPALPQIEVRDDRGFEPQDDRWPEDEG